MAPRFGDDDDSEPDQNATQSEGDKQGQEDADDPMQETQATAHAKLNKKLQAIIGKRKSLIQAKDNLMQVTKHTPNEPLGLGIKAIEEEIEQTDSAQTQVEEEMGLLDPMTYTERARTKQGKVQKALAAKQEEKKRIIARIKEYQEALMPIENEVKKLIKEEKAASAASMRCLQASRPEQRRTKPTHNPRSPSRTSRMLRLG